MDSDLQIQPSNNRGVIIYLSGVLLVKIDTYIFIYQKSNYLGKSGIAKIFNLQLWIFKYVLPVTYILMTTICSIGPYSYY